MSRDIFDDRNGFAAARHAFVHKLRRDTIGHRHAAPPPTAPRLLTGSISRPHPADREARDQPAEHLAQPTEERSDGVRPRPRPWAARQLAVVDVGDGVGDRLPVLLASLQGLLDLDAARAAGRQAVDDVPLVIATEPIVRRGDAHVDVAAGQRSGDGFPDLLLQGRRRAPSDQDQRIVEPVEGHGVGEASADHRPQAGEARLVDVRRRDVPAVEGSAVALPPLAAPCADRLGRQPRCHPLGLIVGVPFDRATVRARSR